MRAITTLSFAVATLLAACCAGPVLARPAASGGPKMLIHGNYCGPGNNAPLPPIDALDAACARHDACTPDGGLPSAACNLRLERDAALISRDPRQPEDLRALAGLVAAGASVIPSAPAAAFAPDALTTGTLAPAPYRSEPADEEPDPDEE